MICKWCGNSISPSATKCKRCGKEVPALSDCGGFYDIAPRARNAAEAPPAYVNNIPVPQQPARGSAPVNNPNNKKTNLVLIAAIAAGFVVVLVLFFVLLGWVGSLSKEVEGIQDSISDIYKDLGIDENNKNSGKNKSEKTTVQSTSKTNDSDKESKDNEGSEDKETSTTVTEKS